MNLNPKHNRSARRPRPEGQKGKTPRVQFDSCGRRYEIVRGFLPPWARKMKLSGAVAKAQSAVLK